jgi:hypothetical protein
LIHKLPDLSILIKETDAERQEEWALIVTEYLAQLSRRTINALPRTAVSARVS